MILKDQNEALLQKVECLESQNADLYRKVDWLYNVVRTVKQMDLLLASKMDDDVSAQSKPTNDSHGDGDHHHGKGSLILWTLAAMSPCRHLHPPPPEALALHGGYIHPTPLVLPQPPPPDTDTPLRLVHAKPPSEFKQQCVQKCVAQGWHTEHFNEWLVNSQKNDGEEFLPCDSTSAITHYIQRLQTFTLSVATKYESKEKDAYSVLESAILKRVNEGASFTCLKTTPSKYSGATLIGCLRCGACLNLKHGYLGWQGKWKPSVITRLNDNTRDFWFSEAMQTMLGLEPDTPSAAHMCTAEKMEPECKTGGIDKDKEHTVRYVICCWMYSVQDRNGTSHALFNRKQHYVA